MNIEKKTGLIFTEPQFMYAINTRSCLWATFRCTQRFHQMQLCYTEENERCPPKSAPKKKQKTNKQTHSPSQHKAQGAAQNTVHSSIREKIEHSINAITDVVLHFTASVDHTTLNANYEMEQTTSSSRNPLPPFNKQYSDIETIQQYAHGNTVLGYASQLQTIQ
jgi:hypothetical protein